MTPIDKLLAIEELKRLKARYFRYIDTKDWSGFAGLFADDAVFDITDDVPGCVLTGPARIAEFPATQLADAVTVHHGHCPEINVTSDRSANAVWAMQDRIWWSEGSSSPLRSLQGHGHYFEAYECIEGRWFIKSMRLRRLRVDVEPRAPGGGRIVSGRLQGRVALVTGSTQGLGEGIATCLAREGARVIVNGRSADKGVRVTDALRELGADAHFIAADVSDRESAQRLVAEAAAHFGGLDILVNNAQTVPALVEATDQITDEYLEVALRSGLHASLWTSRAALPHLRQTGRGRIVNVASINGVYGSRYGLAYNCAKEAIRALTRTLANEWGRFQVTVNVVLPSGLSPAYEAFYQGDAHKAASVAKHNPMRRHGRPVEDIGQAVLGLVADAGAYVTGQSLFVDGGAHLLGLPQLHAPGVRFQ